MVRRKNIVVCILLSLLTCGIYDLFWLVSIANNVNRLDRVGRKKSLGGIMVLILNVLTCGIYQIYWAYKTGERIDNLKNANKIPTSNNTAILYLFMMLLLVVFTGIGVRVGYNSEHLRFVPISAGVIRTILFCLMQNEVNNIAN